MKQELPILVLVASLLLPGVGLTIDDRVKKEQELEEVRLRIQKLRSVIDDDVEQRDTVTARLRDIERLLGSVRRNLNNLRTERESTEARRAALIEQKNQRTAELLRERDGLAGQLRAAYVNGREERIKLLLNQRDPAVIGRQSVYYRYFTESRVRRIAKVEETLSELSRIEVEVAAESQRLAELEQRRAGELVSLEEARGKRKAIVIALEKRIQTGGSQLSGLQRQEQALVNLLEELARVLAEFPVESQQPFIELKGQLGWPARGELLGDFGKPRSGRSMKWNGVLIGAERGAQVRAIAHGRVAYSDWLPGLGLLLVIEHGDGYLSLYGHNERLDRSAGDWVDAGEVLGTVGDSGGQPQPALYFEIRHQRAPVNPHPWFARGVSPEPR
ncbi:MAG: peptidoglycan DD-metalloendopeptidase family protein [Gammaproteobacteria bacterium]|nr:peptidoglycan DD-metalloendopeptidase family protein [Gammaproteobacteria bacterium]MDH3766962.1 peptidoglycan DD-metalloendopeptidase family protein [Gammaproteobacteria bacterium]